MPWSFLLALALLVLLVALALGVFYHVNRILHLETRASVAGRRVHTAAARTADAIPVILRRARRYASPDAAALDALARARREVLLAADADACARAHDTLVEALRRVRHVVAANPALARDGGLDRAFADAATAARDGRRAIRQHEAAARALRNARGTRPTRWIALVRGAGAGRRRRPSG